MAVFDVFLSFSGSEEDRAVEIYEELGRRGFKVFIDRRVVRPGESFTAKIEESLRGSKLFVVYYSTRYAIRHACQFELIHAFIADEKEGGPGRLLVINPEKKDRAHIAPVELQDRLYLDDDGSGQALTTIVDRVREMSAGIHTRFDSIDFSVRARSRGGGPTVEPRVHRYGTMWRLRSALTRGDHPLTQRPGNRTAVLVGLPGAGKTKLLDDFVLHFGYFYGDVHRLDLAGRADAYPDEVARVLQIDPDQDTRRVLGAADDELTRRSCVGRQLWVVDSLPVDLSEEEAAGFVPAVEGVHTVLVTEGHAMPELGETVRLDGLTEDEAIELVYWHHGWPDDEEPALVRALSAEVSRHPMALAELARMTEERRGTTFVEHVGRVLEGSSDLLAQVRGLFAERLRREDDQDRLVLLRLAAVCAPDPVPIWFVHRLLDTFGIDQRRVADAMRGLGDAHLATRDGGSWHVHAIIRIAAGQLAAGEPTAEELAEAAATLLAGGESRLEPALLAHARRLCERLDLAADVRERLLRRVALSLFAARHAAVAGRYFERLFHEFPDAARDRTVLLAAARSHLETGEHERAARLALDAGPGLDALLVQARALDADGRFDEADPCWRDVITHPELSTASLADETEVRLHWVRARRLRGELREHRNVLRDMLARADELPSALANRARLELVAIDMLTDRQNDARALARRVVDHYDRAGATHDPLAAEARFLLANADMTLGLLEFKPDMSRWPRAEDELRRLHAEQERELGPRNIATLTTRTAVGWALVSQGKAVEAREHGKALLTVLAGRVGTDHPLYFRCEYNLGMAYCQLGKFTQAVERLEGAHRGQLVTLGKAHPETLRTGFELAVAIKLSDIPDQSTANALLDEVRRLSSRVTGKLNDLYAQAFTAWLLARRAPRSALRKAHRANHGHKWTED